MPSPSHEERICAMFDSFAKSVARNYAVDLQRAEKSRDKHFADEPVEYLLELLGHEDTYPSDSFVLYVDGHSCVVESEHLYKALQSLPQKQRKVLLLDFLCDRTDGEIAEELEVTTRTDSGMTKSLAQTVYPASRSSYTFSAQIASEDLKKGPNGQVGIEVVFEYEDGSTETRSIAAGWVGHVSEIQWTQDG